MSKNSKLYTHNSTPEYISIECKNSNTRAHKQEHTNYMWFGELCLRPLEGNARSTINRKITITQPCKISLLCSFTQEQNPRSPRKNRNIYPQGRKGIYVIQILLLFDRFSHENLCPNLYFMC